MAGTNNYQLNRNPMYMMSCLEWLCMEATTIFGHDPFNMDKKQSLVVGLEPWRGEETRREGKYGVSNSFGLKFTFYSSSKIYYISGKNVLAIASQAFARAEFDDIWLGSSTTTLKETAWGGRVQVPNENSKFWPYQGEALACH
ncbi:hypothetical protein L3X38_028857 [Prunus dulcis]|uniref:Uncharacterized protein n=1 Tax=Prunus dulcis TaxID=3755 RepID=A0AAD4VQG0_PRUDU|nr:hypothetical protein L3X38_028857 [Prunus dulcis]